MHLGVKSCNTRQGATAGTAKHFTELPDCPSELRLGWWCTRLVLGHPNALGRCCFFLSPRCAIWVEHLADCSDLLVSLQWGFQQFLRSAKSWNSLIGNPVQICKIPYICKNPDLPKPKDFSDLPNPLHLRICRSAKSLTSSDLSSADLQFSPNL